MITFKQFLAEVSSLSPSKIIQRIFDVRDNKHDPVTKKTCWNQVGLYLRAHPSTEGFILLYGVHDGGQTEDQYVNHAVLIDSTGKVLVDTQSGSISPDHSTYTNKAGDDHLDLLLKRKLS